jgi:hypothetical protein
LGGANISTSASRKRGWRQRYCGTVGVDGTIDAHLMHMNRPMYFLRIALLGLLLAAGMAHANEPEAQPRGVAPRTLNLEQLAEWLAGVYSEAEFRALPPDAITLQSSQCSCYDEPTAHYPYLLVVLSTPRGDLILRPDQRELQVSFVKLAMRQGDLYCSVEAGSECYGRFESVCHFTDFRYGPTLAPFFPTCKEGGE